MLRQLIELVDDGTVEDDEDIQDIVIEWFDKVGVEPGEPEPNPGYYAWMEDYPEEGLFPVLTFENDKMRDGEPSNPNTNTENNG